MNNLLPHVASELLGTPLLVHPTKAQVLLSVFGNRIGVDAPPVDAADPEMNRFVGHVNSTGEYRVEGDAAIIPVMGTLVNRGAWIGSHRGTTSYEGLEHQFETAFNDDSIRRIVLDINSPGGAASGLFRLTRLMSRVRHKKPIIAVVNDMAASAAYAIASQANRIIVTDTGIVGSIGVVISHIDQSAALEQRGLKVKFIYAGAHKVDGNPAEPLSEDAESDLQTQVDNVYNLFVSTVAKFRPLEDQQIRKTEAKIFTGQAAIDAGLADGFGNIGDALKMDLSMSGTNDDKEGGAVSQEQVGAAVAGAREDGAAAAKTRISAILNCEAAKGQENLANHLAFETEQTAETAIASLEASKKDVKTDKKENAADLKKAAELAAEGSAAYVKPDDETKAQTELDEGLDPMAIIEKRKEA